MRLNDQQTGAVSGEDLSPDQIAAHVQLARKGNEESAEMLIRFLHPGVSKILNCRLRTSQNKEDAAQEIYIRVFKNLDQYSGRVPLVHWVNRIAANVCSTQYRKNKSIKELRLSDLSEEQESYVEAISMRTSSEDPMELFTQNEFLDQLLATVSPEDQQVIRFVYLQGLSHREVSNLTGWSQSSSKVRAHRAMNRIKKSLRSFLGSNPLEFPPAQTSNRRSFQNAA